MFEVEIKSLLRSKSGVKKLLKKLKSRDGKMKLTKTSTQLNHYFKNGDVKRLFEKVSKLLSVKEKKKLRYIIDNGKSHSVRTRLNNILIELENPKESFDFGRFQTVPPFAQDKFLFSHPWGARSVAPGVVEASEIQGEGYNEVILVVKGMLEDGKSIHGAARSEFEAVLPKTIDEVDEIILSADFTYQSKWSRLRKEYDYKDLTVCIDKNAGYGYLAEFEKVVEREDEIDPARRAIRKELKECGIKELSQERIDRMFEYYNKSWEKYYKTDKTFVVY